MTPVEVIADPAEVERVQRIADTFHAAHPKLRRADIVPTKTGDGAWLIVLDEGVTFRVTVLSPERIGVGRVDPKATDTLLEPPTPLRLLRAVDPLPSPNLVALAVAYEETCHHALDRLRNAVANWEQTLTLSAPPSADAYLVRCRDAYPGTIPSVTGKRLADLEGLKAAALEIIHTAHAMRTVPAQLMAARRLASEATEAIETALASINRPVAKNARLAGEPDTAMASAEERQLRKLQAEVIDKLLTGATDLAVTVAGLQDVTPLFLSSALQALREGYCAAVAIIQQATADQYLRPLRAWGPEREASDAIATLVQETGQAITAPEIEWSLDLLEPPRLG